MSFPRSPSRFFFSFSWSVLLSLALLMQVCHKGKSRVCQFELDPPEVSGSVGSRDTECRGMLQGTKCYSALWQVTRVGGKLDKSIPVNPFDTCCWHCEAGGNICTTLKFRPIGGGVPPVPARHLFPGMVCWGRDWCETSNTDDFYGNNAKALQVYADYLVREYGGNAGLDVGDVKVVISNADPPTRPGHPGVVGGQIGPGVGGVDYNIYLYKSALVGKKLICTFRTITHEFRHIVQVEVDNLPVTGPADPSEFAAYEQDADQWADKIADPSACGATC